MVTDQRVEKATTISYWRGNIATARARNQVAALGGSPSSVKKRVNSRVDAITSSQALQSDRATFSRTGCANVAAPTISPP